MFKINLDKHKPLRKIDNNYLCNVRKRLIVATPEEEVRQSVINFLVTEKGFPIENIDIEVPMTHFKKGAKGRADILISDDDGNIICLIECKEPREFLTDRVEEQILKYDNVVNAQSTCIIIGDTFIFKAFLGNDTERKVLTDFPTFKTLMEEGQVEYFLPEEEVFEKFPFNQENIDLLYDIGVIGRNTNKKYLPFLFNLYFFYNDENDKVITKNNIEDIGIKITKYGNASGGQFYGRYRAFLDHETKSIVSFSISSMTRGEGYPVNTSLMFAVDIRGNFHLSLELNVEKHINITNDIADITHDGTITIGKMGAAKRSDLIDFVRKHKPDLIKDNKIFLGRFIASKEITAANPATQDFIKNCIDYAIIRDKFRDDRKGSR